MQITLLPLGSIDSGALPRDRAALDPEALALLQRSILSEGLRQPIEVFPLEGPTPDATEYGLISGLRRLTVFRALAPHLPTFAAIPAFIRQPADIPAALAAMVTENEVRADISPWEKALLILTCVEDAHFPTPDAAILGLFPHITKTNRSRLHAVVTVVDTLGPLLTHGPSLSLRQLLRLSTAIKAGFAEVIEVALTEHHDATPPAQWDLLQNILSEADRTLADPTPQAEVKPAPKRLSRPHPRGGLTIRREWLPNGWRLVFTGPEAKGMMIESVMGEIERMYGPPG